MKTVKFEGNEVARVVDAPIPNPGPGEVLVQAAVSALCGSELHAYRGEGQAQGNSGHEGAGIIAALGEGVTGLEIGQRVGVSAVAGCGQCAYCARGQYTWCPNRSFYGSMHAEYFLGAANACRPLPEDITWEQGVLLCGDGMGVPYHTSTKLTAPDIQTVAIFGAGPIGLGNVLVQAFLGRRVIAVEISPPRLELAKRLGASAVVDALAADPVEQVRQLTNGVGPDACIEAAGQAETALACFAAVRTAGSVVFNGEQGAVPLSPSDQFIRRDITAIGAWYYHFSEFEPMLALFRRGLRLPELITHHYPFTEAGEAFREFAARRTGKVLLHYS